MMPKFSKLAPASLPLALLILIQSLLVTPAYGLSGGPVQPEFGASATVGSDNLVDPFTGNFRYSVPLMEVGGLPLTLNYSSDNKMEEEASWVGAGWSLNPGAITRQVRGIPDDFNGDEIVRRGHTKPSVTTGITPGADMEVFGAFGLSAGLNFNYSNYSGFNFSTNLSPSLNLSGLVQAAGNGFAITDPDATPKKEPAQGQKPKFQPYREFSQKIRVNASLSANINSRSGMESLNFGASILPTHSLRYGIQFGGFTYTPVADFPRITEGRTWYAKVGGKPFFPLSIHGTIQGQRMVQMNEIEVMPQAAYGYMYLDGARSNRNAIMDYNVEKAGLLIADAPRLPMPFGTPDVFSATGAAMAGQIEVKRNDVGIFRPGYSKSTTGIDGFGGDIGIGGTIHVGVNYNYTEIESKRGEWRAMRNLFPLNGKNIGFKNNAANKEAVHMRFVGETTAGVGNERYQAMGGDLPVNVAINKRLRTIGMADRLTTGLRTDRNDVRDNITTGFTNTILNEDKALERRQRSQVVTYLDAATATSAAMEKQFKVFEPVSRGANVDHREMLFRGVTRTSQHRRDDHISEIRITGNGGQRYIYGLPVYNLNKREVTFNATGLADNETFNQRGSKYGTVKYSAADASVANRRGKDHYFDQVETPAYVTSNLLTTVLSPDYIDLTGDGVSPDDAGNYSYIGYTSAGGTHINEAGWRAPATPNRASYYEGHQADKEDDKASFSFGEKEIFYVHHIDSKTHRAIFYTSDRNDARPVDDRGRRSGSYQPLQKLDSILLFTLSEINDRAENAVPIKRVHLNYATGTDAISGNLPNATATSVGKLTLQSVSFTYQDNYRGLENPYVFDYKTTTSQNGNSGKVLYSSGMVDRWGNQRPEVPGIPGPQRYPYAVQENSAVENYYGMGNLTHIDLPSGGTIDVAYDPDDYAYVQDKRAARMFKIKGVRERNSSEAPRNLLYGGPEEPKLDLVVEVDKVIVNANQQVDLRRTRELYFQDVKQLFFDIDLQLKNNPNIDSDNRIKGFADFILNETSFERIGTTDKYDLTIPLKGLTVDGLPPGSSDGNIHPFTYTGLTTMQMEIPQLIFNVQNDTRDNISTDEMLNILRSSGGIFKNFYTAELRKGDARIINRENSFIRLADPTYAKQGDGTRVRSVSLNDNWLAGQVEDADHSYVQQYSYTTETPDGRTISSGVAANEPMIGSQASLIVNTEDASASRALAPDPLYRVEGPVGFQFYPGPSVGYSKVTMSMTLDEQYQQSKPGFSVYEFYTAKDFPVMGRVTGISSKRVRPLPNIAPFYSIYENVQGLSQGYAIEVNDMHGKQKATREYNAYNSNVPISSTVYRYKENAPRAGIRSIDNLVSTSRGATFNQLTSGADAGSIVDDQLGLEEDLWIETQEEITTTEGMGGQANVDFQIPWFVAPSIYPSFSTGKTVMRASVMTKLIKRYGILEEVEVMNNGSTLSTHNERWDNLTGAPILTSTENEFGQPIYTHNLPAYYLNEHLGMGPAYLNEGMLFRRIAFNDGVPSSLAEDQINGLLREGDEIVIFLRVLGTSQQSRAFVVRTDNGLRVIRDDGELWTGGSIRNDYSVLVLRSGLRNILTAPGGQTTSLIKPTAGDYWNPSSKSSSLIQSSATVYNDIWGGNCTSGDDDDDDGNGDCNNTIAEVEQVNEDVNVQGLDISYQWDADDIDRFRDCNQCRALFQTLYCARAIRGVGSYVSCQEGSLNYKDFIGIQNCDFINDRNPWLTAGSTLPNYQDAQFPDWRNSDEYDCTSGGCFSDGNGDDNGDGDGGSICDDGEVGRIVDQIEMELFDSQGEVGYNWDQDDIDAFSECDECTRLFNALLCARAINNLDIYVNCDEDGSLTNFNEGLISSCAFINGGNPWLVGGTPLPPYNSDQVSWRNTGCYSGIGRICAEFIIETDNDLEKSASASIAPDNNCSVWEPDQPNPYINGQRGNWRPFQTYVANQTNRLRSYQEPIADLSGEVGDELGNNYGQPLIYRDGTHDFFQPFWADGDRHNDGESHQIVNQVNAYDLQGHDLETEDALGIQSGAQYGFSGQLPTAMAQNSAQKDLAYDSFEDYEFNNGSSEADFPRHFGFNAPHDSRGIDFENDVVENTAHTGLYSLRMPSRPRSQGRIVLEYATQDCPDIEDRCDLTNPCACLTGFTPQPDQRYQASFWVARDESLNSGDQIVSPGRSPENRDVFETFFMQVYEGTGTAETDLAIVHPEGPIVDGWQRVTADFTISAGAERVGFAINTPWRIAQETDFYIDDFRVHPYESNMVTYAYDPYSLRLMAQLDDNNYAVYYEYDDEGRLIRQKRETEKGIKTITEQHSSVAPTNPSAKSSFSLEAECAQLGNRWSTLANNTASSGRYIELPNNGRNYHLRTPGVADHIATFTVDNAAAGTYNMWARVRARSGNDDSFHVRINGGSWYAWHIPSTNGFDWRPYRRGSFQLNEGTNIIEFSIREDGTRLDKIHIDMDSTTPTGRGNPASNTCQ